jgi:hypothetical protein
VSRASGAIAALILFAVPTGAQDASLLIGYDGSIATLEGLRAGFAMAPHGYKFTREQLLDMFGKTIEAIKKQRADELRQEQYQFNRKRELIIR